MNINCFKCQKNFISKTYNQKYCSNKCRQNFCAKTWRKNHEKLCSSCNLNTIKHSSQMCKNCQTGNTVCKTKTLGDYRNKISVSGKHPSWKHSHIRSFCRSWNKNLLSFPCQVCGYNNHIELAHIKPLTSFKDSDLLSEINDPNNILVLCPNHHWEFDNKLLSINDIPKRNMAPLTGHDPAFSTSNYD